MNATILTCYRAHSPFTDPGRYAADLQAMPDAIGEIIETIQGLLIYDVVAREFYDADEPGARGGEIHLRPLQAIIARLYDQHAAPLSEPRRPADRVFGRCRHYALLLTAILREKDVPARARCCFATYFNPGRFEDHWVCEYWDSAEKNWKFADAQLDAVWREKLGITFDITNIDHTRIRVAADAWQDCRSGKAVPESFGISFANLAGLWFIAGNMLRDLAALNHREMLPWDSWGIQPLPDSRISPDRLAFFDELAALLSAPDTHFEALRHLYESDAGLRVPEAVFNPLRERMEPVAPYDGHASVPLAG